MGRDDHTISIFVCLISHIPVTETGDLSVSKKDIFKELSPFILHKAIFLSFVSAVVCCILNIQLLSYQSKDDSLCIAFKSIFFQEDLIAR